MTWKSDWQNQVNHTKKTSSVRVFSLEELGISTNKLINLISPYLKSLEWDYYDVRREQLTLIHFAFPDILEETKEKMHEYYSGETSFETLSCFYNLLPKRQQEAFHQMKPYRRRAVSNFKISRNASQEWSIEHAAQEGISQNLSGNDYRKIKRRFPEINSEITNNEEFQRIVKKVVEMVQNEEPDAAELKITCWLTSIVATTQQVASNAPEGIHQDGADYIVSALVLERENILGGESKIYGEDKQTQYLSITLQPGQGIFQPDDGSIFWHDVTPIQVKDESKYEGVRSTLGFDVYITKRRKKITFPSWVFPPKEPCKRKVSF